MTSYRTYKRVTEAVLWSMAVLVVTGASVRLTGSGLGCPDWPTCEQDKLIAPFEYHALIEYLNRVFTGIVAAVAVTAAIVGAVRLRHSAHPHGPPQPDRAHPPGRAHPPDRGSETQSEPLQAEPRRWDLVGWSCGLLVGVASQVILGALLVGTELDPRFVMGHFLLSMFLLWNAAILNVKSGSLAKLRFHLIFFSKPSTRSKPIPSTTSIMLICVFLLGAVVIFSGSLVTGSGPHAGDTRAERLPLLVREVTRVHSVIAIALLILVLAVWAQVHMSNAKTRKVCGVHVRGVQSHSREAGVLNAQSHMPSGQSLCLDSGQTLASGLRRVAALLVSQGVVGYTQYFAGLPAWLVVVHVGLASIIWIEIVRVTYRGNMRYVLGG